jgi:hypothetical protein
MRTKILMYVAVIFFLSDLTANDIYIYGTIKNYSKNKVIVKYDEYNIVLNSKNKIVVKTDENGDFQITISDLRYFSINNYIKVNHNRIYFCLSPGDSLHINFDAKNPQDVIFKGKNSERNIFINDYFNIVHKRKPICNASTAESSLAMIQKYYKLDSIMLVDYTKQFSIDSLSTHLFWEVIKYSYFNSLTTSQFNFTEQFKLEAKSFNLKNEYLIYSPIYYSAITGYIQIMFQKTFHLISIDSLKLALEYADRILEKPYSEIYKAYLIRFYFSWPYKRRIRENPEIKDVINKFLSECNDDILIEELKLLIKNKKIEI